MSCLDATITGWRDGACASPTIVRPRRTWPRRSSSKPIVTSTASGAQRALRLGCTRSSGTNRSTVCAASRPRLRAKRCWPRSRLLRLGRRSRLPVNRRPIEFAGCSPRRWIPRNSRFSRSTTAMRSHWMRSHGFSDFAMPAGPRRTSSAHGENLRGRPSAFVPAESFRER